jgi:hypothetical protein
MIHTMNTVTTNLRISVEDWKQAKIVAQDLGMSLNQYVNWLVVNASVKFPLGEKPNQVGKIRSLNLANLAKDAENIPSEPDLGMSEDDKTIYDL